MKIKITLLSFFLTISFSLAATTPPAAQQPAAAAKANERPTLDDAKKMVDKAIAYINTNGLDKAIAEINKGTESGWCIGELYPYIFSNKEPGKIIAHGAKKELINKSIYSLKDLEGKLFIKEIYDTSLAKGEAQVEYKWTNYVTNQIENKTTYCKKTSIVGAPAGEDFVVICSGAYK